MALQYSGTNVNTTFTCTTGTRQEIVTGLQTALTAAGWTVISGSGTGNVLMESGTTPSPQNLVMRVQLFDPGSGSCAQVKPRNTANTRSMTNYLPLNPGVGRVYRVIANPYQAFVFTASSQTVSREYAAWGVPYLPSFLQGVITECIWANATGGNDTDTGVRPTFRTGLHAMGNFSGTASFYSVNGNAWENFNSNPSLSFGMPQLFCQQGALLNPAPMSFRWHDDSLPTYEPLFSWGLTTYTDEAKIRGQLWDAAIVNDGFTADATTTFDSRTWWVLTNSNTGQAQASARGSLLLVVP